MQTERAAVRRGAWRARAVTALGPATMLGGVVWAFLQPYRVTLLHPHGQGFWWLAVEPPLLVVLAGVVFALFVAPGVIEDLEAHEAGALMQPPAEFVHWMFATGLLLVGLCLLAEAFVGEEVWRRRAWRAYLWPSLAFAMGVLMWPVMVFFTNSTIHMLAHGSWAQVMMLAGAARARARAREAAQPLLAPDDAARVPRLRRSRS